MQDKEGISPLISESEIIPYETEEYQLQAFDIVDISIKTSSTELNELFEMYQPNRVGGGGGNMMMGGGDMFFMTGFVMDESGLVELPLLGKLDFQGLTTKEATLLVEKEMSRFVNEEDLFVRVRLGGIRFTALGEFNSPGKKNILQNRATIFEAIATAGDMTVVAKRDELTLVRQYPEGSKIFKIDMNNKNLMSSEFYFIKPNDMLYAEPMKVRELGTGITFIQTFQLALTTFSAVLLVLNVIK
jgi:polysaccharide biosynthesis/export protein